MGDQIQKRLKEIRTRICGRRGAKNFARRAGIIYDTYLNYEKGTNIPASALVKLARNCNVNMEWLLLGRGRPFIKGESGVAEPHGSYGRPSEEVICPNCGHSFRPRRPLEGMKVLLCDPTSFKGGYRHLMLESLGADDVTLCADMSELEEMRGSWDAAVVECWWPSGRDAGLQLAGLLRREKRTDRIILISSTDVGLDPDLLRRTGVESFLVVSPVREEFRRDILQALTSPSLPPSDRD